MIRRFEVAANCMAAFDEKLRVTFTVHIDDDPERGIEYKAIEKKKKR